MSRNVIESRAEYIHDAAPEFFDRDLYPAVLALVRRHNCRHVLDIGCGVGTLCRRLRENGCEVVGMDPSASGVATAQRIVPQARFYELGVYDDPAHITEGAFDCAVSTDVIEHLFKPAALPRFAAAKLKPGGLLSLSTPYHGYLKNLALSLFDKWDSHFTPFWDGGHIKFWSRSTLSQLLAQNGFQVVAFRGVGRVPGLWKCMILVARKVDM